jgi:GxGYxYP putative glycoside hydrolase C-terminal domain/GxGYxY sequence motif in domain of unknown function N-terminal/Secretion system C-terminal sorting domain
MMAFLRRVCLCLAMTVLCALAHGQTIHRIAGSPYPASAIPDTLFMVNIGALSNSQQLGVVTLQGLLAKVKPLIMVNRTSPGFITDLRDRYGVTYDSTYYSDFRGLINHFRSRINGYIVCNVGDSSTNAAISICSPMNGIAVFAADTAMLDSLGIPQLYNTALLGGRWSFDTFENVYSRKILTMQEWSKYSYLCDYSVYAGAYQFYDFPTDIQSLHVMSHIDHNGAVFGWFDAEEYLVTATSQSGLHMHASDWSSNLTVYSNFSIPQQHQTNHTADTLLRPGVHTVCFLMTDGDNVQWLGGNFINADRWYGNPNRGQVNLGWGISPALAELAPTQMKYIYDTAATTAAGRDGFVAAPSGMGYSYPDVFAAPDSGAAITSRMMQKADLSVLNVIAINYNAASLAPYMAMPNIEGILYYTYAGNYYQLHGFTDCINGKPVISARYNLVQGEYSTYTLAQAINSMPKNPYNEDGYSFVAVNVWSSSVDSVIKCVSMLDSNVRVVTPEAFVKLFKAGNNCIPASVSDLQKSTGVALYNSPNPCIDQMDISYSLPAASQVQATLYDQCGRPVRILFEGYAGEGTNQIHVDTHDLTDGLYFYTLRGDYLNATQKCIVAR